MMSGCRQRPHKLSNHFFPDEFVVGQQRSNLELEMSRNSPNASLSKKEKLDYFYVFVLSAKSWDKEF